MAKTVSFTKRALISKANSTIVMSTGVAAFLVVFCIVASKTLISQATYQNHVISAKKTALSTLKSDLSARDSLTAAYKSFVSTPQNVIGGNPTGTGDKDGDNAKIVLDALPSNYDFPALATSLEKLVGSEGLTVQSITGTDEEITQAANQSSATPAPVAMPFEVQVAGSYDAIKAFVNDMERSIRPFQVQKVELNGQQGSMTATIDAQTFYQPAKSLNIKTEVVK
jgi:Pilus assembly protein, PilO